LACHGILLSFPPLPTTILPPPSLLLIPTTILPPPSSSFLPLSFSPLPPPHSYHYPSHCSVFLIPTTILPTLRLFLIPTTILPTRPSSSFVPLSFQPLRLPHPYHYSSLPFLNLVPPTAARPAHPSPSLPHPPSACLSALFPPWPTKGPLSGITKVYHYNLPSAYCPIVLPPRLK
jgi:hypothetical protein